MAVSPSSALNFGFLMVRVASAARAKLLNGKLFGLALFVLGRHIIAPFTAVALQSYKVSHFSSPAEHAHIIPPIVQSPRWESDP